MKLPCGGGEGAVHSRVVASHGLVFTFSPLKMLQKKLGPQLSQAGAPFKFGPPEGPDFFVPFGWKPIDVRSLFKTASKLKRLPLFLWMMSYLPEAKGPKGSNIWSGICLFGKT